MTVYLLQTWTIHFNWRFIGTGWLLLIKIDGIVVIDYDIGRIHEIQLVKAKSLLFWLPSFFIFLLLMWSLNYSLLKKVFLFLKFCLYIQILWKSILLVPIKIFFHFCHDFYPIFVMFCSFTVLLMILLSLYFQFFIWFWRYCAWNIFGMRTMDRVIFDIIESQTIVWWKCVTQLIRLNCEFSSWSGTCLSLQWWSLTVILPF